MLKALWRTSVDVHIDNNEKVASSINIPNFTIGCKKHTLFKNKTPKSIPYLWTTRLKKLFVAFLYRPSLWLTMFTLLTTAPFLLHRRSAGMKFTKYYILPSANKKKLFFFAGDYPGVSCVGLSSSWWCEGSNRLQYAFSKRSHKRILSSRLRK